MKLLSYLVICFLLSFSSMRAFSGLKLFSEPAVWEHANTIALTLGLNLGYLNPKELNKFFEQGIGQYLIEGDSDINLCLGIEPGISWRVHKNFELQTVVDISWAPNLFESEEDSGGDPMLLYYYFSKIAPGLNMKWHYPFGYGEKTSIFMGIGLNYTMISFTGHMNDEKKLDVEASTYGFNAFAGVAHYLGQATLSYKMASASSDEFCDINWDPIELDYSGLFLTVSLYIVL